MVFSNRKGSASSSTSTAQERARGTWANRQTTALEPLGKRRGLHVGGKARKVVREDFERFDLLIAMDRSNHADLLRLAPTDEAAARIYLLRDFDEESPTGSEVPDPYYGGGDGFEQVLEICEAGCRGLLDYVRERHLR